MPSQVERALAGDAAMTPIAMDVAKASHHHECRARRRLVFKSHLRFFFVSDKVVKKQKACAKITHIAILSRPIAGAFYIIL
jgi:hypothetical protein